MNLLLLADFKAAILGLLLTFLSVFLIMLILIQRGKGGGLTGALGGPGGQSAFGSKAGDTFTLITIVVALVWGFTCAFTMWLLGTQSADPITDDIANIQAGPGDGEDTSDFDPEGSGFEIGGGDGIGGIGGTDDADDDSDDASDDAADDTADSSDDSSDDTDGTSDDDTSDQESTDDSETNSGE